MDNNVTILGIDPGNSGCKVAEITENGIRYYYIPNVTGKAVPLDFQPFGKDEDVLCVEADGGERTFIGELARKQLQEQAEQDRTRNKAESDSVNFIVPAVLGMLYKGKPIVAGVGATLQDYAVQSPKLVNKITGKHQVKFLYGSLAGRTICPEVIETYTYPQDAGALIASMKYDNGAIRRTDWNDKTVMGIDFGHGQIQVAIMQGLEFIKKACFSLDFGFYRVGKAVQDYLNSDPYYVTATIPQLQLAVETGHYLKNNRQIDLNPVIDKACSEIMDLVYAEALNHISRPLLDSVNVVVSTGGGGQRMAPFVQSRFDVILEVSDQSKFDNAKGFALIAKEKWEREHGR